MPTKQWKLLKIDQYILGEIVSSFLGSCFFIIFILLMFQMLRLSEFLIIHGAPGVVLSKIVGYMILSFLPKALPIAFLVSILTSFARLSADSELIALKSCGFSMFRLSIPAFSFAAVIVFFSMALHFKWVPWAELESRRAINKIGNTRAVSAIKEGAFTSGFFDLLIFADKVDATHNRLFRVFIYDEREPKNPLTYVAKEAEIIPIKTESDFGTSVMLRLIDGSTHHNNFETKTYEKMDFKVYQLYLKVDEGEDMLVRKPEMIPQKDLIQLIQNTNQSSLEGKKMRGEYWKRYSIALSPLCFVLLGAGFGSFRQRTAKTGAMVTSLLILSLYWTLQMAGTAALERGSVPPFLAMQFPNFILLTLGLLGFRRAGW